MNQNFKVIHAVKDGYSFMFREYAYLAKIALLPFILHMVCAQFVQLQRPDASMIEAALWQLPSTAFMGWMIFLQVRFMFMGERINNVPDNEWVRNARAKCQQVSVLIYILFNMVYVAATAFVLSLLTDRIPALMPYANFFVWIIIIGLYWAVRYSLLYILAAVDYPLGIFARKCRSFRLSLNIIGASAAVMMPMVLFFQLLVVNLLPDKENVLLGQPLSQDARIILGLIGSLVSLLTNIGLCAVLGFAAKQMIFFKRQV